MTLICKMHLRKASCGTSKSLSNMSAPLIGFQFLCLLFNKIILSFIPLPFILSWLGGWLVFVCLFCFCFVLFLFFFLFVLVCFVLCVGGRCGNGVCEWVWVCTCFQYILVFTLKVTSHTNLNLIKFSFKFRGCL